MGDRGSLTIFPVYLFFASVINIWFLYTSARHVAAKSSTCSHVLLALSIAEFAWVIPCFVQCVMTLISGGGDYAWVPSNWENNHTGCDIMGFYSVFASVSGQLLTTLIAYISFQAVVKRRPFHVGSCNYLVASCFVVSIVISSIPLFHHYYYSGEGFCYIDWSNPVDVTLVQLITIPCFLLVPYFFGSCFLEPSELDQEDLARATVLASTHWWWLAFTVIYIGTWVLWIPAGFIGTLSDQKYPDMFPTGYMIAGGTLGHFQAILNPVMYGYYWRSWHHEEYVIISDGNCRMAVEDQGMGINQDLKGCKSGCCR